MEDFGRLLSKPMHEFASKKSYKP